MISPLFQKYRPRWSWRVRGRGCRGRGVGTPSRGRAGQGRAGHDPSLRFSPCPDAGVPALPRSLPSPPPSARPLTPPAAGRPRSSPFGKGGKKGEKGGKGRQPVPPGQPQGAPSPAARGGEGRAAVPGWQPPAPPAPPGQRAPYPESFPIFTKLNTSIHAAGQLCPSLTHSSSSSSSSMSGEGCVQRQQQPSPKRQPAAAAAATPLRQGAGRAASRRS